MANNRFLAAIVLVCCLWWTSARAEARERYTLHSRKIHDRDEKYVWLHDREQNRVIWKRRLVAFVKVHWSNNRKALAIECQASKHKPGIIVWREGYRLRYFAVPGGHDYPMGCVWSPDNRHLLVRAGGSGAADVDYGELFCLWLGRWPHYKCFRIGFARKMAWLNHETVIFWELEGDNYSKLKKPRLWRMP